MVGMFMEHFQEYSSNIKLTIEALWEGKELDMGKPAVIHFFGPLIRYMS